MLVIFCPKIFDRAENRIRRRLPQTAQGCRLYGLTQFDQPFDITCLALTLGDPFKDIQHSASAQAAGHTFTAGFILDKIHEKRATSTMQVSSSMQIKPPDPMIAPSSIRDW